MHFRIFAILLIDCFTNPTTRDAPGRIDQITKAISNADIKMTAKATRVTSTNSARRMLSSILWHVLADKLRSIAQRQVFADMCGDGNIERGASYCNA